MGAEHYRAGIDDSIPVSKLAGWGADEDDLKGGERSGKEREDLEAIMDLLNEWCMEYGEAYISACIADGAGTANISLDRPDYAAVDLFKDYKKTDPSAAATAKSPNNKN